MTTIFHHAGLRVADAQRAGEFYIAAFGARWLASPVSFDGPGADQAMGVKGVKLRLGLIGIGDGAIELFEFRDGVVPTWAQEPMQGRLPHLGLQVPDTDVALLRVEAAGGKRLWDAVDRWGRARVVYVTDPDGNVLELLDHPASAVADALHRFSPESKPVQS